MSTTPPKPHLRYGELKQWLQENGITEYYLKELLNSGVIKIIHLKNNGRGFYNARQIKRDVLDLLDAQDV